MPVPPPKHAKKVFEGVLATAYQWPQEMYDGTTQTFECYVRHDTTAAIPFLDHETVLMTHQEQPSREPFWDAPGGRVDPGETLEEAARRELHEETGYTAGKFELLTLRRFGGLSRFEEAIYLATALKADPIGNKEDAGEKIQLVPMKLEEAVRMGLRGEIRRPEIALALLALWYDPEQKARLEKFLSDRP